MSYWAPVRSIGVFVYFERPLALTSEVPRALLELATERLALEKMLKISVSNTALRWRKFQREAVEHALRDGETRSLRWMVGTPNDVRLAGALDLLPQPRISAEFQAAPRAWLAAETERWNENQLRELAHDWLRTAAALGPPLSGGVLAARDLRNAKIEITQEVEFDPDEDFDRNPPPFFARMHGEDSYLANRTKIRRVYPLTLLGPKFATDVDVAQLRAAGAVDIEQVNGSLIFGTGTPMLEAWDPQYLEATRALRRLLWPIMAQNPADDPDAPRGKGGRERRR